MAQQWTKTLFDLVQPMDIGDPETFIAQVVAVFSVYPETVMQAAVLHPQRGIALRSERPSLRLIAEVLREFNAPLEREAERARAQQEVRALPEPRRRRTPQEQAAIDKSVAACRQRFGIPAEGLARRPLPPLAGDDAGVRHG